MIAQKIKKAKTDSLPVPTNKVDLHSRPEAENLMGIYSSLSEQSLINTINEIVSNSNKFQIDRCSLMVI